MFCVKITSNFNEISYFNQNQVKVQNLDTSVHVTMCEQTPKRHRQSMMTGC